MKTLASSVCGLLSDTSGAFHLYLSRLLPTHQGAAFSMLTTVRGSRVGPSCSVTLPLMPRASRTRARSCPGSRLSATMTRRAESCCGSTGRLADGR